MKLYKYLPKEFAVAMTETGTIKIGTLFNYRKEEKFGCKVGDESEGKITKQLKGPITVSQESHPKFLKEMNLVFQDPQHIKGSIDFVQTSENLYVYSVSEVLSRDLMQEFGYNSCVEISDPNIFFKMVSASFPSASFCGFHKCVYDKKIIPHDTEILISPALLKSKEKYGNQNEVRALWSSSNKEIAPVIVTAPAVKKLVKILFYHTVPRTKG